MYLLYTCQSYSVKKEDNSWMDNELTTILHKLDKDAEELADERERRRLLLEREEERKRLVLEAELEEKWREQEKRHEMTMQAMMLNYSRQLQYTSHNSQPFRSTNEFCPSDHMPPYFPPQNSPVKLYSLPILQQNYFKYSNCS